MHSQVAPVMSYAVIRENPSQCHQQAESGVCSDPIVDMQYCPSQKLLYGLCDPEHGARSSLQKCDAVTGQCIASAHEFMERWGLTCFCITDQDGAGNEVVAGAANTGELVYL